MNLSASFPCGNALFLSHDETRVVFAPDLRDGENWFYIYLRRR